MRFAAVILLGIAVLAVAMLRPRFVEEDTPLDVREAAAAAGFVVTTDGPDGIGSFFISREPLAFPTQKYNRSTAHEWLGVVAVTRRSAHWRHLDQQPNERVWGRWVAVGDASLLDELEEVMR